MTLRIRHADIHIANLKTRMPFKYGIASMTVVPHAFVRVVLDVDGTGQAGVSADSLPPKWFTKDPATPYSQDVADMLAVIRSACKFAVEASPGARVFNLWEQVYRQQKHWAREANLPPLLWNFGVSLVERAMIDAFCRAKGVAFAEALRAGQLGFSPQRIRDINPGALPAEAAGLSIAQVLPDRALDTIIVRQTVGLGDALTDEEIPPAERIDDGLPQSIEAAIRAYGLTHLKVKLGGDAGSDIDRLRRLAALLARQGNDYAVTLDGNEHFREVPPFRALWEALAADASLKDFLRRLIFVEQPLRRDVALSDEVKRAMLDWPGRPPMIIDESDADLGDLADALACGYVGTSHKNCKGVFKSLTNAAIIAARHTAEPNRRLILSGEDLANVGPVALLQDLAVAATLGLTHVERNGHHYFTGLSMFPHAVQEQVLVAHSDLYRRHERGFPAVDIRAGQVRVNTVTRAPFGVAFEPSVDQLTPAAQWTFASLSSAS